MDRRAHYILRAAAIAVLLVEAVLPHHHGLPVPASASGDSKAPPALAAPSPVPATPVAMR